MNQEQQILNYLREGNAVTPLLALEKFGCMRLASRVHRLREQGYKIETGTSVLMTRCTLSTT